jgi:hypothetical protein
MNTRIIYFIGLLSLAVIGTYMTAGAQENNSMILNNVSLNNTTINNVAMNNTISENTIVGLSPANSTITNTTALNSTTPTLNSMSSEVTEQRDNLSNIILGESVRPNAPQINVINMTPFFIGKGPIDNENGYKLPSEIKPEQNASNLWYLI